MTVTEIVEEHVKASKELRKSLRGSPDRGWTLLIRAGMLNKKGPELVRQCR
jgi:hypothetical protein